MTFPELRPLSVKSLKEECVVRLERLILSGQLAIGQRLPSERNLAHSLGVSRPVLHMAVVDLAGKGLVTISPRRGAFVNDYRVTGSLPLFLSLLDYHEGWFDADMLASLVSFRRVTETEIARLAAQNAGAEQIKALIDHVTQEQESLDKATDVLTGLDFEFHLRLALAANSFVYPLLMNSFKPLYTNLTGAFYQKFSGKPQVRETFDLHAAVADAVARHDADQAVSHMTRLLDHGITNMLGEQP